MCEKLKLRLSAGFLMLTTIAALAAPGRADLTMTYELAGEKGEVKGILTAPLTDTSQQALPEDTRIDIKVTRSAYSLGQMNLVVRDFKGLTPGETVIFTDDILPAWQINQQYTYMAESTAAGYSFYQSYGNMKPGLEFVFDSDALTVTPQVDGKSVRLEVIVPSKMAGGAPLEQPITALEFYRATESNYKFVLIHSMADPEFGETVEYTDTQAVEEEKNYYQVRAVTKYGYADTYGNCYVGLDVPAGPYPVKAVTTAEGVKVSWTAPDRGENWGVIDPAGLWYNVYRCYGYGNDNREMIATRISETSFTDNGADLTEPKQVRYEVEAGNSKGLGGANYSSPEYDITVGPSYGLPFRDTFDGGFTKVWTLTNSAYYARWYEATIGEYGAKPVTVKPVQGTGLVYVDYVYNNPPSGATNTMTSYKINLKEMKNPWVSFWYYAIPDNDVTINFAAAEDVDKFGVGETLLISDGEEKPQWKRVYLPMKEVAGKEVAYIRFTTKFMDRPSSAILDDVTVMNYPEVNDIEASVDEESMSVTLEWSLPTEGAAECTGFVGYVDGKDIGPVTSPWVYEGLERETTYTFRVRPLYEGVEVEASPVQVVLIKDPAVTEFSVGDYDYLVMDIDIADGADGIQPAVCVNGYHGKGGLIRMPGRVEFKEVEYSVQGVADEVFKENTELVSVSMPEGYTFIKSAAFKDASSLIAVSIPASMLYIGENAFEGCGALANVSFAGEVPPYVEGGAFSGVAEDCKGTCPEKSKEAYSAVENMREIDFGYESGVKCVDGDVLKVDFFDLLGRQIASPASGIPHIKRVTLPDGTVKTEKSF